MRDLLRELSPAQDNHRVGIVAECRGVAQLGRASRLGRESRRFESCRPDHQLAWYPKSDTMPALRPWSNRIRHESSKLEDGGSSPSGRMLH